MCLIKRFEGYEKKLPDGRAQAYPDPRLGWNLPTIGWGTTKYPEGNNVQKGDIITSERAEESLRWEVDKVCRPALEKIPTWAGMNVNQRGALFSFAYNLGARFYGDAHFLSISQVCDSPGRWSDTDWIQQQFVKYRNPGSSVEEGLHKRREAEAQLFCTAVA
jgi:GH24 family phage-related lysozyme (muramidase)